MGVRYELRSAVSIVLVHLDARALRLSSCASKSVPVSGEAPNIWVTRSTDSTNSPANDRTWAAPASSAENKRVTDSFMIGYCTQRKLTHRFISHVISHGAGGRRLLQLAGPDATQWRITRVRLPCVAVLRIDVPVLPLLPD